ncbi:MAG: decarboxylase [Actinomycetes bacterium]
MGPASPGTGKPAYDAAMLPELAGLTAESPLLAGWLTARGAGTRPFVIPGHKHRGHLLHPDLGRLVDDDVPMCGGIDTVQYAHGYLTDAESRAAELWGADWARLSVGGSTHGNQTMCLAIGRPGDRVAVTRALHRSTLLGLVLAGLDPVWLPLEVDLATGLPLGTSPEAVASVLADDPGIKAVFLVSPGYLGTATDIAAVARITNGYDVPLIVDQAWGGHLGFHPDYPAHALAQGADGMVLSAHKALPAYSQGAILLARTDRLDRDRLDRAFDATHTTSASGNILAGADAARAVLQLAGEPLLERLRVNVAWARDELRRIPGAYVPGPEEFATGLFDPAKLVVLLAGTGADGIKVELELIAAGFPLELADRDTVIAMTTLADDRDTIEPMVKAMTESILRHAGAPRAVVASVSWTADHTAAQLPREAFFAPHETVSAADAVGRISAEVIAPYPPGVPVLVPGEVIDAEIIAALQSASAAGTRVAYAADPTLATFQVVR